MEKFGSRGDQVSERLSEQLCRRRGILAHRALDTMQQSKVCVVFFRQKKGILWVTFDDMK